MHRFIPHITGALIILSVIISLVSAHTDSLTYDEIAHIGSGYSYLTQNDFRLNPEHPPLLKVLAALPFVFIAPAFDVTAMPSWTTSYEYLGEFGQWDAGRLLLHESNNDTDILTWWSRMPMVLLFGTFSTFLAYWCHTLYKKRLTSSGGPSKNTGLLFVGLLATALWVFNINILGHNHLITTDIGAAAAISVSLFFFLRYVADPTWKNTLILGIVFGLANCIKFSAFILMPFFVLIIGIYLFLTAKGARDILTRTWKHFYKFSVVGIVTLLTIYIIYIPFSFRTPQNVLAQITPQKIHGTVKQVDITTRETLLTLNENAIVRPFTLYLHGFVQVFHRVAGGNRTYFAGDIYGTNIEDRADPLYFPTVFILKESAVHLFLYLITLVLITLAGLRGTAHLFYTHSSTGKSFAKRVTHLKSYLHDHFTELTLLLFILFYAALSIGGNLTIGVRHLFPLYPPLMLLTAITLVTAYQKIHHHSLRRFLQICLVALLTLLPLQALYTMPSHLSFFNFLAGGTNNGYHFVVDSNADWGQGSKRLTHYLKKNNIKEIRVDYFGGDDFNLTNRLQAVGITSIPWSGDTRPIESGYYAISTTYLQDSLYKDDATSNNSYAWTRSLTPIHQIDSSILIYKVE